MKPPRNLTQYTTATEAAKGLEDLATVIRQHAESRPLVRYLVKLDYWNPAWSNPAKLRPQIIYTGADYSNVPLEQSERPRAPQGKV